jgi:rhamnulokinase
MAARVFAAVDIGASGGRVIAGVVDVDGRHAASRRAVTLHTVHRFANGMHDADGHLRWDIGGLYYEVHRGLRMLGREFPHVESIGIDTWAVDYALLDAGGTLLADPIAYRDTRTDRAVDRVHERIGADELYEINGLQHLPFTTLYQLDAEQRGPIWERAAHALLLPDLLAYWLTGTMRTEYTNASTTGLVDVRHREWSDPLFARLGIPPALFPPLEQPGTVRGTVSPDIASDLGLPPAVVVTTVGSHDTASAVVGVPANDADFAYVASGTWSLVGLELDEPVITAASRAANFTNEAGVAGRIRFLRNVGGLWLLQESMREWAADGVEHDLAQLLADAAALPSGGPTIDVDDPTFIPPGDMPRRIRDAAGPAGEGRLETPAAITACIVESLAAGYARTIASAEHLAERRVNTIHIVGGGAQNELLCRRTATLSGVRVVAGPVEATALGNVCVQAMAAGALPDDLDEVRRLVGRSLDGSFDLVGYEPDGR